MHHHTSNIKYIKWRHIYINKSPMGFVSTSWILFPNPNMKTQNSQLWWPIKTFSENGQLKYVCDVFLLVSKSMLHFNKKEFLFHHLRRYIEKEIISIYLLVYFQTISESTYIIRPNVLTCYNNTQKDKYKNICIIPNTSAQGLYI